jgi:hypothetical protein
MPQAEFPARDCNVEAVRNRRALQSVGHFNVLTNTVIAKAGDSTSQLPKPATGHDPEPVPSTSDSHKLSS